jgi:hypothetical protein
MDVPVNAAYGKKDKPEGSSRPLYVAGYRIPTDKAKPFLAANLAFISLIVLVTAVFLPIGIPFLAAKKSEGFGSYVGFFFSYMFAYFAFFLLMLVGLGVAVNGLPDPEPTNPTGASTSTPTTTSQPAPAA